MPVTTKISYHASGFGTRGGSSGDPVSWYRQKVESIDRGNAAALAQAVEDGRDTMKEMIRSRGTGREWSRPSSSGRTGSYPGRVDSGNMLDSVLSYFNETARGNAVGRFGWVRNQEDYFKLQEAGFEHSPGITVEGMYALTDASELVWRQFQREAERVLRGS